MDFGDDAYNRFYLQIDHNDITGKYLRHRLIWLCVVLDTYA